MIRFVIPAYNEVENIPSCSPTWRPSRASSAPA